MELRWLTRAFVAKVVCCGGLMAVSSAGAAELGLPGWMAGRWCGGSGGTSIEEVWLPPAGGYMIGLSRTVAVQQRREEFEFLRVAMRDGVPTYLAQPQGGPVVAFRQTQAGEQSVRFENPMHDFPTRVEYRRAAGGLHAEIAGPGKDGRERVIGFDYTRCADER
jgi:hypothetical protein